MKNERIKSFQDLEIWQLAHKLVLEIYSLVNEFPKKEEFRLTPQMIRAAISIPANIAEGMGRFSTKEFIHYLLITRGSLEEVRYYIILAKDLSYINSTTYDSLIESIIILGKKVNSLITSLKSKLNEE